MVQESTMICIDNSEWMRNGDLSPTRLQCQQEAANLVLQCKLRSNPENAVGLLSMADTVRVLSTMTSEDRKLFCKLHEVDIEGTAKIVSAIKVAHLALKHRQNRNHKMRIVLFIGSPIEDIDNSEFVKLAKKLKKEKVNVDIVCFGEATGENNQLVADFMDTLNGKDGTSSNMVVVSSGSKLTEALLTSAVCRGEDGAPQVTAGAGGGFEFGIDAEEDPELALALRVSLEEQRQRQRQETAGAGGSEAMEVDSAPPPASGTPAPQQQQEPATAGTGGAAAAAAEDVDLATMTEEEQIQWALRMSMMQDEEAEQKVKAETSTGDKPEAMDTDAGGSKQTDLGQLVENPELLKQLVDNLPGGGKDNEKEKQKTDDKESTSK